MDKEELRHLYKTGLACDVTKFVEKKGQYSYLSWVYAVSELLKMYPEAVWGYTDEVVEGFVGVWLKLTPDSERQCFPMPILDHRNKPILKPTAFDINTSYMRGLTKLIAMRTGVGLFLYAGEDLETFNQPARPEGQKYKPEDPTPADDILEGIGNCADVAELNDYYRKHRQTIQGSPRVDEILSEMSIRKGELEEQENQKGK